MLWQRITTEQDWAPRERRFVYLSLQLPWQNVLAAIVLSAIAQPNCCFRNKQCFVERPVPVGEEINVRKRK